MDPAPQGIRARGQDATQELFHDKNFTSTLGRQLYSGDQRR